MISPAARVRRRRPRWGRIVMCVLAASVVGFILLVIYAISTAPNPVKPSRGMIIGTWRNSSGAIIKLEASGKFYARGLPVGAGESSIGNIPSQGAGRWMINSSDVEFMFSKTIEMDWMMERLNSHYVMFYDQPGNGRGNQQFVLMKYLLVRDVCGGCIFLSGGLFGLFGVTGPASWCYYA